MKEHIGDGKLPSIKRDRKTKKRFGVYYYKMVGDFAFKHDTSGSTDRLVNAYANAAGHCARSELEDGEYAQALVFDRKQGRIVRSYKRPSGGSIIAKDFK